MIILNHFKTFWPDEFSFTNENTGTLLRKINFDCYTSCISNYKIPDDLKKKLSNINNFVVHNIEENINSCVLSNLKEEQVISPVYISDNKLLN